MINQVYRLVSPRQFEVTYKDRDITSDKVVIRPTHLSICAADQRYYTGNRSKEAMYEKLPMSLIHEGVGVVAYDPTNTFDVGTKVVMVPNAPTETDSIIAENYLRSSKFRSSGYDGFMQDYVFLNPDRVVELPQDIDLNVAAFTELVTITTHALTRLDQKAHNRRDVFGVWGDGNLGYITCLFLKKIYPKSKVIIFGKTDYKLNHFSFVDETIKIDSIPENLKVDHAIECAGGRGSQYAINQMIDVVNPEATLSLLGVSEYHVEINTRMILEKGLTLIGSSRSGASDFIKTVEYFKKDSKIVEYLTTLIGEVHSVSSIEDITQAFESDLSSSWGKTILEWKI